MSYMRQDPESMARRDSLSEKMRKKINRRKFIKKAIKGGVVVGVGLLALRQCDYFTDYDDNDNKLDDLYELKEGIYGLKVESVISLKSGGIYI